MTFDILSISFSVPLRQSTSHYSNITPATTPLKTRPTPDKPSNMPKAPLLALLELLEALVLPELLESSLLLVALALPAALPEPEEEVFVELLPSF